MDLITMKATIRERARHKGIIAPMLPLEPGVAALSALPAEDGSQGPVDQGIRQSLSALLCKSDKTRELALIDAALPPSYAQTGQPERFLLACFADHGEGDKDRLVNVAATVFARTALVVAKKPPAEVDAVTIYGPAMALGLIDEQGNYTEPPDPLYRPAMEVFARSNCTEQALGSLIEMADNPITGEVDAMLSRLASQIATAACAPTEPAPPAA